MLRPSYPTEHEALPIEEEPISEYTPEDDLEDDLKDDFEDVRYIPTDSRWETYSRVALMVLTIVFIGWRTKTLHDTCDNKWMTSIIKAGGIHIVSLILVGMVSSIFRYVAVQEYRRNSSLSKTMTQIADFFNPGEVSGMATTIVLSYTLSNYFTSNCQL